MRATICPKATILTKAHRGMVSIVVMGRVWVCLGMFLILNFFFVLFSEPEISFLITPNWQYVMLLTFGG